MLLNLHELKGGLGRRDGVEKLVVGEPAAQAGRELDKHGMFEWEGIDINDKTFVTCHNHLNAIIAH